MVQANAGNSINKRAAGSPIASVVRHRHPRCAVALYLIRLFAAHKVVFHCAGMVLRDDRRIQHNREFRLLQPFFVRRVRHAPCKRLNRRRHVHLHAADFVLRFCRLQERPRQQKCRSAIRCRHLNRIVCLLFRLHFRRKEQERQLPHAFRRFERKGILKAQCLNRAVQIHIRENVLIHHFPLQLRQHRAAAVAFALLRPRKVHNLRLNFLRFIQLPAEAAVILIAQQNHRCVLRAMKFNLQFIVVAIREIHAARRILNRHQRVVDFFQLPAVLVSKMHRFRVHHRLIKPAPQGKHLARARSAFVFFLPRHPVHLVRRNRACIFVRLIFRRIVIHVFHCTPFEYLLKLIVCYFVSASSRF